MDANLSVADLTAIAAGFGISAMLPEPHRDVGNLATFAVPKHDFRLGNVIEHVMMVRNIGANRRCSDLQNNTRYD